MRVGRWIFQPGWASTVAVLLLLPALLSLGFWQLERARQKAELQAAFAERSRWPATPLDGLDAASQDSLYRRVIAAGHYDSAQQILLDNQLRDGRPGYHVLTPLRLADGGAILVNRGWTPLGESRQTLPDIAVTAEALTVHGWLGQPANPGLRLGDQTDRHWPQVTPYIDYAQLAALLGYPLRPALVLLEPNQPHGYLRDWRPRFGGFGPERHQGYAVQWFALAATLVVLYLATQVRRASNPVDDCANPSA